MTTTTRLLMEKRRTEGPKPPEEIDPGVLLAPGMKAEQVRMTIDGISLRTDDVIVVASPKNGTTWMQQIVKLVSNNGVETGIDVDAALPWIEMLTLDQVESIPSPRYLKTQLPYGSMPGGDPRASLAKYVYVYRNPKDAAVAMYYHVKLLHSKSSIQWSDFFEPYCIQGKVPYGHVVDHAVGWWKHRDSPNIHIESYESMKKDTQSVVKRVSKFLGYELTNEVVLDISKQVQFENMKNNEAANFSWMKKYHEEGATPFLRKGIIGDWRNHFTDEQSTRMNEIIAAKLKDADGLVYDYGSSSES